METMETEEKISNETIIAENVKTQENQISKETLNISENSGNTRNSKNKQEEKSTNTNKKLFIFITILSILIISLIGLLFFLLINKKPFIKDIPISSISINSDTQEIEVGKSIEINSIIEPSNYTISNLQWISSNPDIISVNNGIITGNSVGETKIYCIDNEIKSNELTFNSIIGISEIKLDKTDLSFIIGETKELSPTVLPENASNNKIYYESSNNTIASVDENGKITAIGKGDCEITISNYTKDIKTVCNVTVKEIEVKSVSLDEKNVTLGVGQSYLLLSSYTPTNATNKNITWDSSNTNVVTVKDGNLKAIGKGTADITITSNNNKTAKCLVTVNDSKPNNPIKYIMNTSNVRSGKGTNNSVLLQLNRNDEIEILKNEQWSKIRTSNGTIGFISNDQFSSSKTYFIENVPYINQFSLGYPTGCEAVSAAMAAKFGGYNVDSTTIIKNTPTDEKGKREEIIINENGEEETIWVGSNPFEVFVGHPSKGLSTGSYGCFANPITIALRNSGVSCTDISNCSTDSLFGYIKQGKPVIVWCKKNALDLEIGVTWQYPDKSGSFTELIGEHCAVLIGYNDNYVYLNDPSAGQNVTQPRGKFLSNWKQLYSQAVIIN